MSLPNTFDTNVLHKSTNSVATHITPPTKLNNKATGTPKQMNKIAVMVYRIAENR